MRVRSYPRRGPRPRAAVLCVHRTRAASPAHSVLEAPCPRGAYSLIHSYAISEFDTRHSACTTRGGVRNTPKHNMRGETLGLSRKRGCFWPPPCLAHIPPNPVCPTDASVGTRHLSVLHAKHTSKTPPPLTSPAARRASQDSSHSIAPARDVALASPQQPAVTGDAINGPRTAPASPRRSPCRGSDAAEAHGVRGESALRGASGAARARSAARTFGQVLLQFMMVLQR